MTDPSDEPGLQGGPGERAGFLGFVAHEVRNPLATALWSAELLVRLPAEERAGARGDKLAAMCLRSLGRVRQLVEDHLLCERLDAGGIALRPEPVRAREALDAAIEHRPRGTGPVELDVDPGLSVRCDRPLLDRLLETLVAVAGLEGAAVRIAARERGGAVALSIAGRPATGEALLDPVKGSPSDVHGRALALPLARRIAATLGGSLRAAEGGLALELPGDPGPERGRAP